MGRKTIVVTIKRAGKAYSWEGSRGLASHLVDPLLFTDLEHNPAATPLCSRRSGFVDPFFGEMERSDLVPGTTGWVGIDVDRRVIWDAQAYQESFGDYLGNLESLEGSVPELPLPDQVLRALKSGPWCARPLLFSKDLPWTRYPALGGLEDWKVAQEGVVDLAIRETGRRENVSIDIRPSLAPGWRLIGGLHPVDDEHKGFVRFRQLMKLLRSPGWGWKESFWPQWREHGIQYLGLNASCMTSSPP